MVMGSTENNGIFRVTVECLLSAGIKTHGRRLFSLIDLFPPYFIQLCQNIHPKTPLKCDFSICTGPNTFTFWSANFQIKLAPLILYTTLVYTIVLRRAHHHLLHALLSSLIFTCKIFYLKKLLGLGHFSLFLFVH
jgi:hypothetical protein